MEIRHSAMVWRSAPCSDSGLPKATRERARDFIISKARSAWPIARMQ